MSERLLSFAADALLSQGSVSSQTDVGSIHSHVEEAIAASLSHSLSSLDRLQSESVTIGAQLDGKMSVVRRLFCLFVLFDLLLTAFTWLIIVMLTEGALMDALKKQIIDYDIHRSLFDLVMAAICRFTILLLFYGLLHYNTKFYVALTTFGTCSFLIVKVIYFDWKEANQTAIQVPFLLIPFVLAWTEVWFIDFRVVPQEQHAREYMINRDRYPQAVSAIIRRNVNERLLRHGRDHHETRDESEGGSRFYSPLQSAENSDDEDSCVMNEWAERSNFAVNSSYSLITNLKWRKEKSCDSASVYTTQFEKLGLCFKLITEVNLSKSLLIRELHENICNMPLWNPAVSCSEIIQTINVKSDIIYQVSSKTSLIKPRDFVLLRKIAEKFPFTLIAAISITHPSKPEVQGIVRAESGPCCWALRSLPNNPNQTEVIILLNADMKLWIPPTTYSHAIVNSLLSINEGLQRRVELIKQSKN